MGLEEKKSDEAFLAQLRSENLDLNFDAEHRKARTHLIKKEGPDAKLTRESLTRWMKRADRRTLTPAPKRPPTLAVPAPAPPLDQDVAHIRDAAPKAFAGIKASLNSTNPALD